MDDADEWGNIHWVFGSNASSSIEYNWDRGDDTCWSVGYGTVGCGYVGGVVLEWFGG